jgi:hypothetical protein
MKSALGYGLSRRSASHKKDSSSVGLMGGIGASVSGGRLSKHVKA